MTHYFAQNKEKCPIPNSRRFSSHLLQLRRSFYADRIFCHFLSQLFLLLPIMKFAICPNFSSTKLLCTRSRSLQICNSADSIRLRIKHRKIASRSEKLGAKSWGKRRCFSSAICPRLLSHLSLDFWCWEKTIRLVMTWESAIFLTRNCLFFRNLFSDAVRGKYRNLIIHKNDDDCTF